MEFRIADTFTDSLARLTGDEQKAVKTAAFDLQLNPAHPSLQFHKLDKPKDRRFWSIRVISDVRLIVHRTEYQPAAVLCRSPRQRVSVGRTAEARNTSQDRRGAVRRSSGDGAGDRHSRSTWRWSSHLLPRSRLRSHLCSPASRKTSCWGTAYRPNGWPMSAAPMRIRCWNWRIICRARLPRRCWIWRPASRQRSRKPVAVGADPFAHPDAQRRFRVMANVEELERALDYPWDKWTIFLHPAQRTLVERDYSGPARVAGSAGTGKTIVALHRAVFLVRANPDARVLLTTFSDTLANALRTKLRRLISNEPRLGERLEVHSMNAIGRRLYEVNLGRPQIASRETVRELLSEAAGAVEGHKFSLQFLLTEWEQVVDAWQLESWESYRDVVRLGRKTRLQEAQRARALVDFRARSVRAQDARSGHLLGHLQPGGVKASEKARIRRSNSPWWMRRRMSAFRSCDSLRLLGRDARTASSSQATWANGSFSSRSLGKRLASMFGGVRLRCESTTGLRTRSERRPIACWVPKCPTWTAIRKTARARSQRSTVHSRTSWFWILPRKRSRPSANGWRNGRSEGIVPHEIGVFVRSAAELDRARAAVEDAKLPYKVLDDNVETTSGRASISTMHLAKGLEFRTVVVMACDDEVIPSAGAD